MADQPRPVIAGISGAGIGAVVAWAWNAFVIEPPMPAEIAAILAGVIGGVTGPLLRMIERIGAK